MTKEIIVKVKIAYHKKLCLHKCQFLIIENGCVLYYEELEEDTFRNYKRCSQCLEATGDE